MTFHHSYRVSCAFSGLLLPSLSLDSTSVEGILLLEEGTFPSGLLLNHSSGLLATSCSPQEDLDLTRTYCAHQRGSAFRRSKVLGAHLCAT